MEYWVYWIIIAVILTIIEACTTNIVCIWFVASSLLAMIISLFTDNLIIQIGVFALLGVILLILTKPFINKYLKKQNVKTNLDRVVGMIGTVTHEITKNNIGEVKVDGKKWSAISKQKLNIGETVKVLKIEGVKLVVEKEEEK